MKASKLGNLRVCASKGDDTFLTHGYTNWKDACGEKSGGFPCHKRSQVHKYCAEVTSQTRTQKDVSELVSSEFEKQKTNNRAYLRKVLENVIFLAREGLPMWGTWVPSDEEGGCKYTDHHIQNKLLQILALGHQCKIVADINEAGYFRLDSDEVTDSSNKEQVIVCLRLIDTQFEAHEEFIGLHHLPDITTSTVVSVFKDTVLRMN